MADLDAQGFEKGSAQMTIEITEDELKITLGKKRAVIPVARSPEGEYGPDLLVFLDDLSVWLEPEDMEISLEDLAKLAEMIEAFCDRHDIILEFE